MIQGGATLAIPDPARIMPTPYASVLARIMPHLAEKRVRRNGPAT